MSKKQIKTSLYEAAQKFAHESYEQSTMRQVLINFMIHKEATRLLIKEMELLSKDLK
jgi:hypothetical protein